MYEIENANSTPVVPAMMHASSESRAVAKKYYSDFPMYVDTQVFKRTFINWEKDVVFFPTAWHLRHFIHSRRTRATHLKENIHNFAIMSSHIRQFHTLFINPSPIVQFVKKLVVIRKVFDESGIKSGPLMLKESAVTQDQAARDISFAMPRPFRLSQYGRKLWRNGVFMDAIRETRVANGESLRKGLR
jgi:hypothetical protein